MSFFTSLFTKKKKSTTTVTILNPTDFKTAINSKKVLLIDVRTSNEYHAGHINKAISLDYFKQRPFLEFINQLDKELPIYLYCRSGNRSKRAAKQLSRLGFLYIYDLRGGYLAWV